MLLNHLACLGLGLGSSLGDHFLGWHLLGLLGHLLHSLLGGLLHSLLGGLLGCLVLLLDRLHLLGCRSRRCPTSQAEVHHGRRCEDVGLVRVLRDSNGRRILLDGDLSPFLGGLLDQGILFLKHRFHCLLGSIQAMVTHFVLVEVLVFLLQISTGLLDSSDSSSTGDLAKRTHCASTASLPGSCEHFLLLLGGVLVLVFLGSLESQVLGTMVHKNVGKLLLLCEFGLLLSSSLLLLDGLVLSLVHLASLLA